MGADAQNHINSSGFPLQIGLGHAINAGNREHGWHVLHTEHGWLNQEAGESGFIDLVVENSAGTIVLNVECKRPQDATWLFLLPEPDDGIQGGAKYWVTSLSNDGVGYFDWLDAQLVPASCESGFCVVAGQDSKSRPMLERIAAQVVESTEALAREEEPVLRQSGDPRIRTYINVIVTTATLEACRFDASAVSLDTGKIDAIENEEVEFIRFRKQLSPRPRLPEDLAAWGFDRLARAKENTVFVVQAKHFIAFMKQIHLDPNIAQRIARNT